MKKLTSGFTLIELIITLGIFILLGGIVFINIAGRRSETDLFDTQEQIAAVLREAQSNSMAQKNGVAWGVHFDNSTTTAPFYILFFTAYSATTTVGGNVPLPASVSYNTSTLASGATLDVIFSQLVGNTTSTSVGLYMPKQSFSNTITIASSGAVSY